MTGKGDVAVGRITGVYGVRGWVKILSYTEPGEAILDYRPWRLRRENTSRTATVAQSHAHGKGLVARIEGVDDRDAATALVDSTIAIAPEQLAPLAEGEYYWAQLIGLEVVDLAGRPLGVVDHLLETGANDVLVVMGERETLIPYVLYKVIESIDLERGVIRVNWVLD